MIGKNEEKIEMLKRDVRDVKQMLNVVAEEKKEIVTGEQFSEFNELVKQRDFLEGQIISIKSSHNKCNEEIENFEFQVENSRKATFELEIELKRSLEELKVMTDRFESRKDQKVPESIKKRDIPKADLRPFPASSFSFNFGLTKTATNDRKVTNRSFNIGERSSRSSNPSNNSSMILDSQALPNEIS